MPLRNAEDRVRYPGPVSDPAGGEAAPIILSPADLNADRPSLIHFSRTPLFRLEKSPETYLHLLKKKDADNVVPIINYFIGNAGRAVYLAGDAVWNLYFRGRRKKYKTLSMLAIVADDDAEKYAWILNNIITSNDGAFSLGLRYRVRRNRSHGGFRDIACARYAIEPRLVGLELLLYLFRPSTIELDIITRSAFSSAFGIDVP